jgi:hypothetical protein
VLNDLILPDLLTEDLVHVSALTRPFSLERDALDVAQGSTIAELLLMAGIPPGTPVRVYLNGDFVYPEFYHVMRPKRGAHILVRVVPRGGGGGGQGKNIGSIIVGLLLIVVGVAIGLLSEGGFTPLTIYMIGAGISLVLSGIINILIPPPTTPKLRALAGLSNQEPESPSLSIAGSSNAARPYQPVQRVFGTFRIYPPYAAVPYTEMVGSDQYLRLLFCISIGPTWVEDIRIGQTSISNYTNVEMQVTTGSPGDPPITLYTTDVDEQALSVLLQSGQPQIRTSAVNAVELSIDLTFPEGLVFYDSNGNKTSTEVDVQILYRLTGTSVWVPAPGGNPLQTIDARQNPDRNGLRWRPCLSTGPTPGSQWYQYGLGAFVANNVNNGDPAVKAFDVNAGPVGAFLLFDAGPAGVSYGRVVINILATGTPSTWYVDASPDGVTWYIQTPVFSVGSTSQMSVEWPAPGLARYWRLVKTSGAVSGPDYSEIQFWAVSTGAQFDVQVTRQTVDAVDPLLRNVCYWAALRTFAPDPPVKLAGLALLALRIKATDQLNGVIDQLNCLAHSEHLDWATYAGTVLADDPLGYWRLGEIVGAPTAFDATGNNHAGTYEGGPALGAPGLVVNDADTSMQCDGANDMVDLFTGLTQINMGAMSFTVECIIRPATASGFQDIVGKGFNQYTAGGGGWSLLQASGLLRFARTTATFITAPLAAGQTYHVVATFNIANGLAMLWINGTAVTNATWSAATYPDTYPLRFANGEYGHYNGLLDEVAIYPYVLPDARIVAHYNAMQGTREWIVQNTSNPASHYREVLQSAANARPVPDSRLDIPDFQAWHEECDSGGRSCNLVVDYSTAVYDLLKVIAATGRATPAMHDLKFATVRDVAQTVPVQYFTPRNSWNFKGTRVIPEVLHGLKVTYIDPDAAWQQVDRYVYDDGYDATNATQFEAIQIQGVTDRDLAWRLGRYHMACAKLRRESYSFQTDVENLACRRGDLVRLAHDVPLWGVQQGRVKSVNVSAGKATGVILDEVFPMLATGSYTMRFRLADLTSVIAALVTVAGESNTVQFQTPMAPPYPDVGNLAMMGLVNSETVELIVSQIRPGPDLSATLTCVDASPGVLTADQGNIPAFDPQITLPIEVNRDPPLPIIDQIVSDETVLVRDLDGSLRSAIVISLHYKSTSNTRADYVEARYKRSDSTSGFEVLPRYPPDAPSITIVGVEDGVAYDLRVRTVNNDGPASQWAEVLGYVVVGKSTPPPAPTNLRLIGTDLLVWDYPTPPLDFDGFILRRSPGATGIWDTGLAMHAGIVSASPFTLPPIIFHQWTFMVAAVDTSGNESAPAMLTYDFGNAALHNQVDAYDYKAHSFPGTITQGSIVGGNLVADQISTGFWTVDANRFWSAAGTTLFWAGAYKQMTYVFQYTPASTSAGCRILIDDAIVAASWTLEWMKGSLPFAPYPGSLEAITAELHTFRLITSAATIQGSVSFLTLYVDADDVSVKLANVAIASGGTRLTLPVTFRGITNVQCTVILNGSETAVTARANDKQNLAGANNGPMIQGFNAAGTGVACHVDVVITGY